MRSARLAAVLCAVSVLGALWAAAAAQPAGDRLPGEIQQPDGALLVPAPLELRDYDPATAPRRFAELDRAIGAAREPIIRARFQLERARLRAALGRYEKLGWLAAQLRRDQARDPVALRAIDAEIEQRRGAATRANAAAIVDFTELVCDPADRGRGFLCRPPAALRAWPALDDALFQLAYVLSAEQRTDDAARVYRRIIDEHPRSRHRGHALIAAADRAFDRADLTTAEGLYHDAQSADGPSGQPIRAYAAYKLGWIHLNLGRTEQAIASFAAVPGLAGDDPRSTLLVRESRRDLSRAMALRRPTPAAAAPPP